MKFCPHCGYKLPLESASFCSECGKSLGEEVSNTPRDSESIIVDNTRGDVFGVGSRGSGNIFGKEVTYTAQGNIINFHFSGNISKEVIDNLQKLMSVSTRAEQTVLTEGSIRNKEDDKIKTVIKESSNAQQQIRNVLEEINKIEKKEGTLFHRIQLEDVQISKIELLLKEYLLKGNVHYYRKEHHEAIISYNKALDIDPKNVTALINKGNALGDLGKDKEAIECYNKALEIDPKQARACFNKGVSLANSLKYKEAIECYNKALEIDPKYVTAWMNKGNALGNLGKDKGAIKCYNKALEIDPKDASSWYNKGVSLGKLRKYKESIKCFDMIKTCS